MKKHYYQDAANFPMNQELLSYCHLYCHLLVVSSVSYSTWGNSNRSLGSAILSITLHINCLWSDCCLSLLSSLSCSLYSFLFTRLCQNPKITSLLMVFIGSYPLSKITVSIITLSQRFLSIICSFCQYFLHFFSNLFSCFSQLPTDSLIAYYFHLSYSFYFSL